MRFYTDQECGEWSASRKRQKPDVLPGQQTERVWYEAEPHRFFTPLWIATSLTYRMPALLWITESGIWPSSENWHLYYKLRQSYHDVRLLDEAPGHMFLGHESEDLASFLQVAMLNGWGGYLLTQAGYVNAFFSHDGYFDFYADSDENLAALRKALCSGRSAAGTP